MSSLVRILLALVLAAVTVAFAGWLGGETMAWLAAWAVGLQWLAFVPAYLRQTERFYDLVGSLTYITVILAAFAVSEHTLRGAVIAGMVLVWAVRLGSFLFRRVHASGGDGRFDAIKPVASRFLVAWTLQGMWVVLTSCAAVVLVLAEPSPWTAWDGLGWALWAAGFALEVVADRQKSAFREREAKAHPWIDEGLWSWSRHPNYLGEILLWTGIALSGCGVYAGATWAVWVSPVFVALLLRFVSGVPLLEQRADARWGDDPAYQAYKARVGVLVPGIGRG